MPDETRQRSPPNAFISPKTTAVQMGYDVVVTVRPDRQGSKCQPSGYHSHLSGLRPSGGLISGINDATPHEGV